MKIQYETELYHHGIRGQKWGVRRFQNPDGSLTSTGRKRYASEQSRIASKASKKEALELYKAGKYAKAARRQEAIRDSFIGKTVKPLGSVAGVLAKNDNKAFAKHEAKANAYAKTYNETMKKMSESGYDISTKKAKAIAEATIIYLPVQGFFYARVNRVGYNKTKFKDPTQPKTREERKEEQDATRLKYALHDVNKEREAYREVYQKADKSVGSVKTGYKGIKAWADPDHPDVQKVHEHERKMDNANKRYRAEYDRYIKQHPNSQMDLTEFRKKRNQLW